MPDTARPATLAQIETPALVLDRRRLDRNLARMSARAKALGVDLRAHVKTSKSPDIARLATVGHSGAITVSTLAEAEYFFANGFRDMTYAVPIAPGKLARAAALIERGADLKVLIDSMVAARAIADHGGAFKVLIEIDCGEHRTGVPAEDPVVLELAAIVDGSARARIAGVLAHAGHSYRTAGPEGMADVAEDERHAAVTAAERLRAAGHAADIVSVGATPTALFARHLDGVTETRVGVYMLGDLFQAGIGSCTRDDIAVSVLATIIAHHPERNMLYIDAGGIALSKDRGTQALPEDCGFGLVCDAISGDILPGLVVRGVHQEHGEVTADAPLPFEALPIGGQLRVLPNHVCMTAAQHDRYHVTDGTGRVSDVWERCRGW